MSKSASHLLTLRLEQIGAQFEGLDRTPRLRMRIQQATLDEIAEVERLTESTLPLPNTSRVRKIIQARIDGHNN